MSSHAIHSRFMILPEGIRDATVLFRDGRITELIPGMAATEGTECLDAGDKWVMPGVIDPHVHINEPGRTAWEGFDTATRAAIAGGITMLVDMPLNATPVTTTSEAFDTKLSSATPNLHTDCGFWGGLVPGNENEIAPLAERGVLGFKAFLTHSGIDDFPNVTEEDLRKAMPLIARYDLPLLVHCELESGAGSGGGSMGSGDDPPAGERRSYRQYLRSRPREWEDRAIALMIRLCEQYGCRTHIVHLSSSDSIGQIRRAKERGLPLTAETAQHYLYFAAEDIGDGQTSFKCAPPIREWENNDKLWQALKDGIIDFVATDHSPAPPSMKAVESGDLIRAWGGISSIQLALPVLWTAARQRGLGAQQLVKWLCEGPARLIGESSRRGKISPGYMADLVVFDPERFFRVRAEELQHRHKLTPYLGEELAGVVEQTWLNGEKVFDRGAFTALNKGSIILHNALRHA